ncbi:MAG: hypothetical protein AAFY76_19610, partial [Cyanobacteria bacterium J06649_11]
VRYQLARFNRNNKAEKLWKKQMRDAEVQTVVLNVSPPEGSKQYQDNREDVSSPEAVEENYCLLGLVLTIQEDDAKKLNSRNLANLPSMLKLNSVFYYWFGPTTTGVSLAEAQRLFNKLSSLYKYK